MIFGFIQARKIRTEIRIQAMLCMKVDNIKKVSDFSQPFVPHSVARPRFAFFGASGVNV